MRILSISKPGVIQTESEPSVPIWEHLLASILQLYEELKKLGLINLTVEEIQTQSFEPYTVDKFLGSFGQ